MQRNTEHPQLVNMDVDYKDLLLSNLRLLKFSWTVCSCLETYTQTGELKTLPLSKTGQRVLRGQKYCVAWQTCMSYRILYVR